MPLKLKLTDTRRLPEASLKPPLRNNNGILWIYYLLVKIKVGVVLWSSENLSLLLSDVIAHISKRKFQAVCHLTVNLFFRFLSKFYLSKFYHRGGINDISSWLTISLDMCHQINEHINVLSEAAENPSEFLVGNLHMYHTVTCWRYI